MAKHTGDKQGQTLRLIQLYRFEFITDIYLIKPKLMKDNVNPNGILAEPVTAGEMSISRPVV